MADELEQETREENDLGHEALLQLMHSLQSQQSVNHAGEVGSIDPIKKPEIEIKLNPSRDVVVSGEMWAIEGVLTNRGDTPIWLVDSHTTLTLAPELLGNGARVGSIGAFFPTIRSRPSHEVVRIDPGATYSVIWKIDPSRNMESSEIKGATSNAVNTLKSFAFVPPSEYRITACIHIWTTLPEFDDNGNVDNLGASFTQSLNRTVKLDPSPIILVFGSAIGGILCFLLQILSGLVPLNEGLSGSASQIVVGLLTAILLTSVVTTLLSRLSNSDFIINIKVKDLWGAIATGIIVQWLGYKALIDIISTG